MSRGDRFVKVVFPLDVDDDGFPPVGSESINAEVLADGNFQLDNSPFFAEGVSLGDVVAAEKIPDTDERYWFKKVIRQSENRSLSIILLDPDCGESVAQELRQLGCYCEYGEFNRLQMFAVSLFPNCDREKVYNYLEEMEKSENLSYAELAV